MPPTTKPYFIRALYEWCCDQGYTPYIAVWVNEHTRVPAQYVQNNEIVLSISQTATKDLHIDNDWIHFHARFGGVPQELWIPVGHVISIFAKESGEGMGFEPVPWQPEPAETPAASVPENHDSNSTSAPSATRSKVLKFTK